MNAETTDSPAPPSTFRFPPFAWFLTLNALALVVAAVWLRGHSLDNIPGVNGDEGWHGVKAWQVAHDSAASWHTPTGNPINPLFVGPLAILHLWLPPSIGLLRSVALASGLAALVINWLCCRWVFDRRTATISTVLLAILPINIAYSRFGWDTSQSLAATLPAVYFALAAVRFPGHFGRWLGASILALIMAFWVHPTNSFAGAAIAVVFAMRWRSVGAETRKNLATRPLLGISVWSIAFLTVAGVSLAVWACMVHWTQEPMPGRLTERLGNLGGDLLSVSSLIPRLFAGGTIYRYIAGSRSWFEWPLPANVEGWGVDVAAFWLCACGSAWLLWKSNKCQATPDSRLQLRSLTDGVLLAAWTLQLVVFVVVGGPQARVTGYERFAICLIGPTVLLLARGAALAWEAASPRWRVALAVATLAGWALLADFDAHYFRFIERTGGQAHLTFRTAAVEPKQATLQYILEQARTEGNLQKGSGGVETGDVWIVCSEWWNLWPIRYLAVSDPHVHVVEPNEIAVSDDYRQALAEGQVWFVEFCDSEAERQVETQLAGRTVTRREFFDYGGRPVLRVLRAERL
jgi:hypothetical protein